MFSPRLSRLARTGTKNVDPKSRNRVKSIIAPKYPAFYIGDMVEVMGGAYEGQRGIIRHLLDNNSLLVLSGIGLGKSVDPKTNEFIEDGRYDERNLAIRDVTVNIDEVMLVDPATTNVCVPIKYELRKSPSHDFVRLNNITGKVIHIPRVPATDIVYHSDLHSDELKAKEMTYKGFPIDFHEHLLIIYNKNVSHLPLVKEYMSLAQNVRRMKHGYETPRENYLKKLNFERNDRIDRLVGEAMEAHSAAAVVTSDDKSSFLPPFSVSFGQDSNRNEVSLGSMASSHLERRISELPAYLRGFDVELMAQQQGVIWDPMKRNYTKNGENFLKPTLGRVKRLEKRINSTKDVISEDLNIADKSLYD